MPLGFRSKSSLWHRSNKGLKLKLNIWPEKRRKKPTMPRHARKLCKQHYNDAADVEILVESSIASSFEIE